MIRIAIAAIVVVGIGLPLSAVITGPVAPDLLATAATILIATAILAIVAALLVGRGLPRLVSRHDRVGAALVCAAISALFVGVAGFLAAPAADHLHLADLPQIRTRAEFISQRDAPTAPGGVLIEGTISQSAPTLPDSPALADDVVAWFGCPRLRPLPLPGSGGGMPQEYLLDIPGGPPVIANGQISGRQTWGWPDAGSGDCVLRHGTPVVVWGHLTAGMGIGRPTSRTGLSEIRMISVGNINSFLDDYGPVAERTARIVLGWAALNMLLALAMAAIGVRTFHRLSLEGTDAPRRITWRSGSP